MNRLLLAIAFVCASAVRLSADESPSPDLALEPASLIVNPWRFHIPPTNRQWSGPRRLGEIFEYTVPPATAAGEPYYSATQHK